MTKNTSILSSGRTQFREIVKGVLNRGGNRPALWDARHAAPCWGWGVSALLGNLFICYKPGGAVLPVCITGKHTPTAQTRRYFMDKHGLPALTRICTVVPPATDGSMCLVQLHEKQQDLLPRSKILSKSHDQILTTPAMVPPADDWLWENSGRAGHMPGQARHLAVSVPVLERYKTQCVYVEKTKMNTLFQRASLCTTACLK